MMFLQLSQLLWLLFYVSISAFTATAIPISTSANDTTQWWFAEIPPSVSLTWYTCLSTFQCAYLDVPLDYSMPDGSRASIPLIKLPAQANSPNGSYKGMILTNPGGPGGSGIQMVQYSGTGIQELTGTNWDIVSWDPRGIGQALPSANCSLGLPRPVRKRDTLPKIYGPDLADSFWEENFSESIEIGETCQTLIGGPDGAGPHMTTAVNVRDMISILDAYSQSPEAAGVPESHMLNYWGFSYGTYIGETFGTLFPERVGKVILDGVVDPEAYSSGSWKENLTFMDAVFSTFFVYCNLAGPTLCPFYSGTTALDIYNSFEHTFTKLDPTYAFAQNWTNATFIEHYLAFAKLQIFELMYSPIDSFWALANLLPAFLNETAIDQGLDASDIPSWETLPVLANDSLYERAVACPDSRNAFLNSTMAELQSNINAITSQSVIGGEQIAVNAVYCTGWPIVATDVFAGPFGGDTANPILFISNTMDPVCPIQNGQNAFPKYRGAELLTIEAQGLTGVMEQHTSQAAQNSCANAKIGAFFQTGVLPGNDNYCSQEAGAFGVTLPEKFEERDDWKVIKGKMQGLRKRMMK